MKVLSIRQPYAFAIVEGFKPVENRDWAHGYRGPLLIHAGQKEERDDVDDVLELCARQSGRPLDELAALYCRRRWLGAIVGAARMVDCVRQHDSEWFFGPFGFVLVEPIAISAPVYCRGLLGIYEAGADVLDQMHMPPYVDAVARRAPGIPKLPEGRLL